MGRTKYFDKRSLNKSIEGINLFLHDSIQGSILWPVNFYFDTLNISSYLNNDTIYRFGNIVPGSFDTLKIAIFNYFFHYKVLDKKSNDFNINLWLPQSLFAGKLRLRFIIGDNKLFPFYNGVIDKMYYYMKIK